MPELYLPGLNLPEGLKRALAELSKHYSIHKAGGKGANGYLFFGNSRVLETAVAVKFYFWGSDKKFHAEPQTLASLTHQNVLRIHAAGYVDDEWAYFVTSYCKGGDLDDLLAQSRLGNSRATQLTCHLLSGLSFLHGHRLLHRDLKPENIYLHDGVAIIGDFGSIKRVPDGADSVPSSSHSLLYRPPETIESDAFTPQGDVYQAGLVFYQLLGGYLPYDEASWLTKPQLKSYIAQEDPVDRTLFADKCLSERIRANGIVDRTSLPAWVPASLHRVIAKATHGDLSKRFASPADFMARLNAVAPTVPDWAIEDGIPTRNGETSYRIIEVKGVLRVEKKRTSLLWRRDNTFEGDNLRALVEAINQRGS